MQYFSLFIDIAYIKIKHSNCLNCKDTLIILYKITVLKLPIELPVIIIICIELMID